MLHLTYIFRIIKLTHTCQGAGIKMSEKLKAKGLSLHRRRGNCSWGFGGCWEPPNGSRAVPWWGPGSEATGSSGAFTLIKHLH